ncbi:hypothetical protein ABT158_48515 [Nonomuraea sp. NPDC001636]|uniref:hypothetical protein n=1 Tax=Nonomuraea sp. NPDC001636 TaxID=3154391 RepID=UPI003324E6B0
MEEDESPEESTHEDFIEFRFETRGRKLFAIDSNGKAHRIGGHRIGDGFRTRIALTWRSLRESIALTPKSRALKAFRKQLRDMQTALEQLQNIPAEQILRESWTGRRLDEFEISELPEAYRDALTTSDSDQAEPTIDLIQATEREEMRAAAIAVAQGLDDLFRRLGPPPESLGADSEPLLSGGGGGMAE